MCGFASLFSLALGFMLFLGTSFAVPIDMSAEAAQPEAARPVDPVGIAQIGSAGTQAQDIWIEVLTLAGHDGAVHTVDWSPDGTRLVSGGADGTVRIWDTTTGAELLIMRGHERDVWSVDWSPDGLYIASGGEDGTVRAWDAATGVQRWIGQEGDSWVSAVAWAPHPGWLASAHGDGIVRIWDDTKGWFWLDLRGHEYSVNAIDWSISEILFSGGGSGYPDNTVRRWNMSYFEQEHTFWGHRGEVWTVAVKNGVIASGSTDHTVRLWGAYSGDSIAVLEGHTGTVAAVDWDPTGQYVVSASGDGSLRIWDTQAQQPTVTIFDAHGGGWINDVAWASDGRIASAGTDGLIRVWRDGQ